MATRATKKTSKKAPARPKARSSNPSTARKASAKKAASKKAPAKKAVAVPKDANTSSSGAKRKTKAPREPRIPLYTDTEVGTDELEFIEALTAYKEDHGRLFPKQSEILHILRHLGYSKS